MGTALAWTDQADLGAGEFVIEDYLDKMHQNQESLISQPVGYSFDEVTENGTGYVSKVIQEIYVPPAVATLQGDVVLAVRLDPKVDAGTGRIQIRLGSGSWVESSTFSNTSYGTYITLIISNTDLKAVADSYAELELQLKVAATGPAYCRYNGAGTHFERQP